MEELPKLLIKIENSQPVELFDMTLSMAAIANEYKRFMIDHPVNSPGGEIKLYIKEIRSGSIETELAAMAPSLLPLTEHAGSIIAYAKHLKTVIEWFAGKSKDKPAKIDKAGLQNLSSIVEPIAKDNASQFNIGVINGPVTYNININSTEANAVQNKVKRELESLKEPVSGIHEKVLLYWVQAKNQKDGKTGDRAKIESIYKGSVKVVFINDELKIKMLYGQPYPFKMAFVVDVAVETINERPALYKVLEIHESIELEAEEVLNDEQELPVCKPSETRE